LSFTFVELASIRTNSFAPVELYCELITVVDIWYWPNSPGAKKCQRCQVTRVVGNFFHDTYVTTSPLP
jgi:hypothetical protein